MDSFDEIPLEDHHFFAARLAYLETHQPKTLLDLLENDSLTSHLRERTSRAMKWLGAAKSDSLTTTVSIRRNNRGSAAF